MPQQATALLLLLALQDPLPRVSALTSRFNVLFFAVDDLRYQLGTRC
jgi:hypothetical protein